MENTQKVCGRARLHARHMARSRHVIWLGQRELIRFERAPMGTQAYLISTTAAQGFLNRVPAISRPIDWEMDCFWANGLSTYALFPFPCFELAVPSSITKAAESINDPKLSDRIIWFVWKSKEYMRRWFKNICLRLQDKRIKNTLSADAMKF